MKKYIYTHHIGYNPIEVHANSREEADELAYRLEGIDLNAQCVDCGDTEWYFVGEYEEDEWHFDGKYEEGQQCGS